MFDTTLAFEFVPTPCRGFGVAVLFPDVEPDVLANEDAFEGRRCSATGVGAWQNFMRRVLPAMERSAPADLAEGLLAAGQSAGQARAHAAAMRRRAIAGGDVVRARFWAEVTAALHDKAI